MENNKNKIIRIAEKLGWLVKIENNQYNFTNYSPAGQEISISITASDLNELLNEIKERCDNYDCSEETYLWLDNTGHGKNGAPHDMKEVYEDMESCLEMMNNLYKELMKITDK